MITQADHLFTVAVSSVETAPQSPADNALQVSKPSAQITPSVKPIPHDQRCRTPIYYYYQPGQQHINRNGSIYIVKEVIRQTELLLVRSDGWQLTAHNPRMYLDGVHSDKLRMEWDFSTGGIFTDQTF